MAATSNGEIVVRFDHVWLRRAGIVVLEDITFDVRAGQFIGLVGPNGAGKTTLLKAMLGLLPTSEGSIEVFGLPPGKRHRETHSVGYVPQRHTVHTGFPASVGDVVMMGRFCCMGTLAFPRKSDWKHVEESLAMVGLSAYRDRPVGRLSGGELRRVTLAQALCASTRLLVLDEPTIGLDLPAEHEFYELLRRLQDELGLTVVAVSHDLVALGGQADELICINRRMHVHGHPEDVVHSHAIREAYSCEFSFLAGELAHHDHGGAHEHAQGAHGPAHEGGGAGPTDGGHGDHKP